jgi:fido (protein-threonine AMPylation protein)
VRNLVDDVTYWVAPDCTWLDRDQAVARVHHRLVAIHPFPNGNGRHARAYADLIMRALGGPPFTWGAAGLHRNGPDRQAYLAALRAADADPDDIGPLVRFARS